MKHLTILLCALLAGCAADTPTWDRADAWCETRGGVDYDHAGIMTARCNDGTPVSWEK